MNAPRPRPVRADRLRNRERLLAAATEVFNEHGPDASLDEIARRAGVGNATLYRHFPQRLELLEAVYRDQVEELCASANRLRDTRPPVEAFETWLREYTGNLARRHGLAVTLKAALGAESKPVTGYRDALRAAAGSLLAGAQKAGAVRADVDLLDLLTLVHGVSLVADHSPQDPDQLDRLLAIVLAGLRAGA